MVSETQTPNPSPGNKRLSNRRKQICLQVIVGMVILFCGIVIGSGAVLLHLKDRMMMPGPRPPLNAVVEDIQARYDLTQEQAKQVEDVFGRRRETLQAMFEESGRKMEAEFQKLDAEMKKILSPEQYEDWDQDFRTRRGHGPWGRGPGRPGERGTGPRGPGERGPGLRRPGDRGPGLKRPGERGPGPARPPFPEPNSTPE